MSEELIYKSLKIGREFTKEEISILADWKKIIDAVGSNIGATDLFENLGSRNIVSVYIVLVGYDIFRSIFDVWIDAGYHSAYILGRSLSEYYIDLLFILKRDTEKRSAEYYEAFKKNKRPFSDDKKFKWIENRAKEAGLGKFYSKTYSSLCSFTHVNLKGGLIMRQTSKFKENKPKFMSHMVEIFINTLYSMKKKFDLKYSDEVESLIEDFTVRYKTANCM